MPDINPSIPVVGQPDSTEEPKIVTALTQLIAAVNDVDTDQIADGAVQSADLHSTLLTLLGLTSGGTTRRKSLNIPAEESRTNTSYGTLTTADKLASVVMPTDGLILVGYQALWKESVGQAARAAIFIGANQIKLGTSGAAAGPLVQEAATNSAAANIYIPLATSGIGLLGGKTASAVDAADTTTGQILGGAIPSSGGVQTGGFAVVWADAGTYDISVQFKSTSGSVTAKNRHLWALALGF